LTGRTRSIDYASGNAERQPRRPDGAP